MVATYRRAPKDFKLSNSAEVPLSALRIFGSHCGNGIIGDGIKQLKS